MVEVGCLQTLALLFALEHSSFGASELSMMVMMVELYERLVDGFNNLQYIYIVHTTRTGL